MTSSSYAILPEKSLFPYCIVWSPLPFITWFLPFIGHTGIADSDGYIYDFAGPYTIGKHNFAFGEPTRYIQLDPKLCTDGSWNDSIGQGCDIYSRRMHNLFCDNCHSHVAKCLNIMGYKHKSNYTMISIGVWVFFSGKFVGWSGVIKTYLPFLLLCMIFWIFF
jgi:hypothetical protein